jgi:hypothetical protein
MSTRSMRLKAFLIALCPIFLLLLSLGLPSWAQYLLAGIMSALWFLSFSYFLHHEKLQTQAERNRANQEALRATLALEEAKKEKLRAAQIGEVLINRVGFQVRSLEIQVDISTYEGNCNTIWKWSDVQSRKLIPPLMHFSGKISFDTPNCSFTEFPSLLPEYDQNYEIRFLIKEPTFCDFYTVRRFTEDPEAGSNGLVEKKVSSEFSYGYKASISRGFMMDEEALANRPDQNYFEWFGFHIDLPLETLSIKISFPANFDPDELQYDVCIAGLTPNKERDLSEVDRIVSENGFRREVDGLSLSVRRPKVGDLYYLRWTPPPKAVVKAMKTRGDLLSEQKSSPTYPENHLKEEATESG